VAELANVSFDWRAGTLLDFVRASRTERPW
jgi:hypothetical protein